MLLIDGDIVVYKAGFGAQKTIRDDSESNGDIIPEPVTHAFHKVNLILNGVLAAVLPGTAVPTVVLEYGVDYRIYLTSTDKSNYRFKIAKTKEYKGNRKAGKPIHYDAIREFMCEHWNAEVIYGMEADDKMGIEACRNPSETVIASIDKDMLQIPCLHYNMDTGERVDALEGHSLELIKNNKKLIGFGIIWFYAQMLMGDNADNIPGIPKYGPVKAYNALSGCNTELDMLKCTYGIYKDTYGDDAFEMLMEVGDLLWILRNLGEYKSTHLKQLLIELGEK